jgi:hypothetical protein
VVKGLSTLSNAWYIGKDLAAEGTLPIASSSGKIAVGQMSGSRVIQIIVSEVGLRTSLASGLRRAENLKAFMS